MPVSNCFIEGRMSEVSENEGLSFITLKMADRAFRGFIKSETIGNMTAS